MNHYITGATIRELREKKKMTQLELAARLGVSDKTVSKWETSRGLPDITLLEPLAKALGISVAELLTGDCVTNRNVASNMQRSKLYVCPVCGNAVHAMGEAVISCCGITLPALEAEEMDEAHEIRCERIEDEYYVTVDHEMPKTHHIAFLAYVTSNKFEMVKLYAEGNAEARFLIRGSGTLYAYCNRHGLMKRRISGRLPGTAVSERREDGETIHGRQCESI